MCCYLHPARDATFLDLHVHAYHLHTPRFLSLRCLPRCLGYLGEPPVFPQLGLVRIVARQAGIVLNKIDDSYLNKIHRFVKLGGRREGTGLPDRDRELPSGYIEHLHLTAARERPAIVSVRQLVTRGPGKATNRVVCGGCESLLDSASISNAPFADQNRLNYECPSERSPISRARATASSCERAPNACLSAWI
jgi:hypothetical protein